MGQVCFGEAKEPAEIQYDQTSNPAPVRTPEAYPIRGDAVAEPGEEVVVMKPDRPLKNSVRGRLDKDSRYGES
ncbi:hypothetical protein BV898_04782 [Hypsibius exemplaris]|uniref:Uncharacterized protein n=1 Tax=Hypsibius exemplaris TaxID=2072580 RepID=A0A1W0X1H8_HYPEX|nr:hypothetical protein BV898_04782 [Hypsibius exemplaris]